MYYFNDQEEARILFSKIAEKIKEEKTILFLVVTTAKDRDYLIADLKQLLQDNELKITKEKIRIKGNKNSKGLSIIVKTKEEENRGMLRDISIQSIIYL